MADSSHGAPPSTPRTPPSASTLDSGSGEDGAVSADFAVLAGVAVAVFVGAAFAFGAAFLFVFLGAEVSTSVGVGGGTMGGGSVGTKARDFRTSRPVNLLESSSGWKFEGVLKQRLSH